MVPRGADTAGRFSNYNSKTMSFRGHVLASAGRASEARAVLQALETVSRKKYVPPYAMAFITLGLGDKDATFAWLERALAAHDVHLMFLTVDPKWDPLRDRIRGSRRSSTAAISCGPRVGTGLHPVSNHGSVEATD